MGAANEHPTALNFKYRLRWYILGKHANIILSKEKNANDDNAPLFINFDGNTVPTIKKKAQLELQQNLEQNLDSDEVDSMDEAESEVDASNSPDEFQSLGK